MEKHYSTSFTPSPDPVLFLSSKFLTTKLTLILLSVTFYSSIALSQETVISENGSSILELKTFLSNQKTANQNGSSNQNVEDLIHKLQPSTYFYDGTAKSYGENPSNLFTDISSLTRLKDSEIPKNGIKIVRISINNAADLNSTIDLSVFSNFKNLKYIYIFSNIPITPQNLSGMIHNNDKKYSIFYKIDRGESNQ